MAKVVVTPERIQMLRKLYGPKLDAVVELLRGDGMSYPIILNGDHAEFERDWTNVPPHKRPDWPLPSFDARDWAVAFCKLNPAMDEGLMIAWFANALMRGFDEHAGRVVEG